MKENDPNADELAVRASSLGEVSKLADLLRLDPRLANAVDGDGRSAMMHAVLKEHSEVVILLIRHSADVNWQDNCGYTALHFAAQDFLPEMAALLLKNGALVDIEDKHGNTPLFKAVFNSAGRGDVIKLLLAAGADRDHENRHGVSPAQLARSIANYPVAQFLS